VAIIAGVVLSVGFYYGLDYAVTSYTHEETDDAFLESHVVTVAPRVAGLVLAVHVKENQRVKVGEPLLELDPKDFEVQLEQKRAASASAEANLASAQAGIELVKARYATSQAAALQEAATADADRAKADQAENFYQRAQKLRHTNVMSEEEFDRARAEAESTKADLRAAEQKAAASKSQIEESRAQITVAKSILEGMATRSHQAVTEQSASELELSYTKIVAPCDGQVVRKSVEPGNYVQTGQSLLALVTTQLWVVANFKESQLAKMRAGQDALVRLDAYPDHRYKAHVDSFQAGSGSRFSLLPPENAVGNYVKVVQRVPVKLYFDEPLDRAQALGPGMSVVPEVRVRDLSVSRALLWVVAIVLGALATLGLVRVLNHVRK
jgi:membrane fusion protein, multidrug efflux system